jgi:hypothetical protein
LPDGSATTTTTAPVPSSATTSGPSSPPSSPPALISSRQPFPPGADRIEHRDRVFVTGASDTGKSIIARAIFRSVVEEGPKLIIDPTDSEICDVGCPTFRVAEQVDLTLPVSRFVPLDPFDLKAYDTLYGRVNRLPGPAWIWDDECRFSCPASGCPHGPGTYVTTKRKREMGGVWCNTKPLGVFREVKGAAKHILSTLLYDDPSRDDLAGTMSVRRATLDSWFDQIEPANGAQPYSFLYWHVRTRELQICDPLPRELAA